MIISSLLVIILGVSALYIISRVLLKRHQLPLPPGPKGLPILGNVSDLPPSGERPWLHWLRHKDLYGPLSSVTVMGQTMIIINDRSLAIELLDKRSAKHSGRLTTAFAMDMCGWAPAPLSQGNNSRLRAFRKAFSQFIGSSTAFSKFEHMQEAEVRRLLLRLLQDPKNLASHIKRETGGFVLNLSYGYAIEPEGKDYLVDLSELALDEFGLAYAPGKWLVDLIPTLKHLPDWFPGSGFKQVARKYDKTRTDMVEKPFAFTKYQMARNEHNPSIASSLINNGEDEDVAKWTAAAVYSAGQDSTSTSINAFFLAMSLYPEVQAKAQAEIDRVVGHGRLPSSSDRDRLPYMNAIVKEVLRWHTVAPLAVPHMAEAEDICNGYRIPKGAVLIPNCWAFNYDAKTYPSPFEFNPDRFIPREGHEPELDPNNASFGFGRRICPGRLAASRTIFLTASQCIAAFEISKAIGEDGREVEPELGTTGDFISHLLPFQCTITPRSSEYVELIQAAEKEYPIVRGHAKILEDISY